MQRDMDLVRDILFQLERDETNPLHNVEIAVEGHSAEQVAYHVMLMQQAGLIEADKECFLGGHFNWLPRSLTWAGHEFLDASRDDTTWRKGKDIATKATGGVAMSVVTHVLSELAKAATKSLMS